MNIVMRRTRSEVSVFGNKSVGTQVAQVQLQFLNLSNKHHNVKALFNSFHFNGHTLGFHSQTQKLEPPCTA